MTWHVEHWEFRRSVKEVLYPMASKSDQIFFYRCMTQINAPLEPIIVWAWLLALPEVTIGSTRASRTGLAQGKRQNASADEARRRPAARIEKIIVKQDRKKIKRNVVRGMSLWVLASPGSLWGPLYYSQIMKGIFHIAGGVSNFRLPDQI